MTQDLIVMRFGIDWDDDGFFNYEAVPGDPLNIIPFALSMRDIDILPETNVTITRKNVLSLYGTSAWEFDATGATIGGFFGKESDNTIDDIPVAASTQYTLSVWVRGIATFTGDTVTIAAVKQDGTTIATSSATTLVADWTRINLTFTTPTGTTHIAFDVAGSDATSVFQITGFMLVAGGTAPGGYNTGDATNRYDNITLPSVEAGGVMSANWNSGRANPEDIMFSEGEAELVLNNSDKRYSPEYSSSPLFGYIKPNLRLTIAILNPATDDYEILWTGWTGPIQPAIGADTGTRQALLPATQGKYRLDATPLRYPISQNVRTDEIIDGVLVSGWFSAATPYVTILDRSRLDENTFLHDLDDIRTAEVGDSTFTFVGEDWIAGETAASEAIEEVLSVERGYTWIDRSGLFVFRNRHYYATNTAVDYSLSVDTQLNDADYRYGDEIYNEIKVSYYPKETLQDIILWESKETITIPSKQQRVITAKFEYEEGGKITATSINNFDTTNNPSLYTAVNSVGTDVSKFVSVSVGLRNGEGVITIRNNSKYTATVTVTLKGNAVTSAGSSAVTVSDENSIDDHGLYSHPALTAKAITDEETAEDLGNFILGRFSQPFGTFDRLYMSAHRSDVWLGRVLGITLGSLLEVSETQTGAVDKLLIVVGEAMNWRPGVLEAEYVLTRPETPSPWILGISALDVDTYLGY